MGKLIKYQIKNEIDISNGPDPNVIVSYHNKTICCADRYLDANLEIVRQEAYNGVYTVDDYGAIDVESELTVDDIINALLGVSE